MTRTILTAGAVAGLIAGGLLSLFAVVLSHAIPVGASMAIGYLSMLLALSAIVVAIRRQRAAEGAIGFWRAFGLGIGVTLVAGLVYALCWEVALLAIGGPDGFIDGYLAQLREGGASAAELQGMEAMRGSYRNPLIRLPLTFSEIAPVGVLVSLVAALALRTRTAR
jgi:hypothetical protein